MASLLVDLGAIIAILVLGSAGAQLVQRTTPLVSVGRITRAVVLGLAAVGPFLLADAGVLPVASGVRREVTPLAVAVVLFLLAARVIGFWTVMEGPAAD